MWAEVGGLAHQRWRAGAWEAGAARPLQSRLLSSVRALVAVGAQSCWEAGVASLLNLNWKLNLD